MDNKKTILLAAGGTGGHLAPAIALANELIQENYQIILITDERCSKYLKAEYPFEILCFKVANFSLKPLKFFLFLINLVQNISKIVKHIYCNKIKIIITFGGYTSLAANISSIVSRKKLILHEQNSVAGRLNKLFAVYATKIFTSFPNPIGLEKYQNKTSHTGFLTENFNNNKAKIIDKKFTILIIGGSQGAAYLANLSKKLFVLLDADIRKNIKVIQQVKAEQKTELAAKYAELNISCELSEYFFNMGEKYQETDLAIARAGASTIAELVHFAIPAIYIPYPHAMHDHQFYNAKFLADRSSSFLYREDHIDYKQIATLLYKLIKEPEYKQELEQKLNILKSKQNSKLMLKLIKEL
ncbi:MAG: UDP-N-acetylglucosamine--N-acetylmuramyl-(pentapeptide) pyrophosphoryl-undecaprenol N-acetylglucosamine transferase [Rickettsiales bacterium]